MSDRPRVAVSSCLLGHHVRHDGADKRIPWVVDVLASAVELVAICPEVAAGMSVPRPPIRLVENAAGIRKLAQVNGGGDVHSAMRGFCSAMQVQLATLRIHGYLFKARSPSCGLRDTPHFSETGSVLRKGPGLWAETIMTRWPDLPTADERDVKDDRGRDAFLRRVHHYCGR